MTSSLVGSEMCIRDRWTAGPPVLFSRITVGTPLQDLFDAAATFMGFELCLLYTSDAADDM
eukprot:7201566-Prorocentrum_lima.AAC.1